MTNRKLPGLTLIETVVAVGLLSSVGTLLVPTLSKAREDAKRLTCLSRLGQTGAALVNYVADLEAIPFFMLNDNSWTSWSFGGWSGRNREFWEGAAGGVWNIQTNQRPLTVYMTPWTIPDEVDRFTPTQEAPLFQCPADNISAQWQWGGSYLPGLSAYDDVGTSYELNLQWFSQVEGLEFGYLIYAKYIARQPDRFITMFEDPADLAFVTETQTMGYHGEFSTHMAAFADGHAEYLYMDTRHLHDSPPNPPGPRHGSRAPSGRWTVGDENREHSSGGRHIP